MSPRWRAVTLPASVSTSPQPGHRYVRSSGSIPRPGSQANKSIGLPHRSHLRIIGSRPSGRAASQMECPIADFKRAVVAQRQHPNNKMPYICRIVATTWRPNWPEKAKADYWHDRDAGNDPVETQHIVFARLSRPQSRWIGRRAACLRYASQNRLEGTTGYNQVQSFAMQTAQAPPTRSTNRAPRQLSVRSKL